MIKCLKKLFRIIKTRNSPIPTIELSPAPGGACLGAVRLPVPGKSGARRCGVLRT